jgi:hypothetical protein
VTALLANLVMGLGGCLAAAAAFAIAKAIS